MIAGVDGKLAREGDATHGVEMEPPDQQSPRTPKEWPMRWVVIAILGYLLLQVSWIVFNR